MGSLFTQTRPLDVIILAVNGNLSGTAVRKIGAMLSNPRLRILPSRDGLPCALNDSLSAVDADIVFRLDVGDVAKATRVEKQAAMFSKRPELSVVGSQMLRVDEASGIRKSLIYPTGDGQLREAIFTARGVAHPAVAFRRKSVLNAGGYREDLYVAQDFELWMRMSNQGFYFANHAEILTEYWVASNSLTASYPAMRTVAALNSLAHHYGGTLQCSSNSWATVLCRLHVTRFLLWRRGFRWIRGMARALDLPDPAFSQGREELEHLATAESVRYLSFASG